MISRLLQHAPGQTFAEIESPKHKGRCCEEWWRSSCQNMDDGRMEFTMFIFYCLFARKRLEESVRGVFGCPKTESPKAEKSNYCHYSQERNVVIPPQK